MADLTIQYDRLTPTERDQLNELVAAGREAVDEINRLQTENERLRWRLEGIAVAATEAAADFQSIGQTAAATFARSVAKVASDTPAA